MDLDLKKDLGKWKSMSDLYLREKDQCLAEKWAQKKNQYPRSKKNFAAQWMTGPMTLVNLVEE